MDTVCCLHLHLFFYATSLCAMLRHSHYMDVLKCRFCGKWMMKGLEPRGDQGVLVLGPCHSKQILVYVPALVPFGATAKQVNSPLYFDLQAMHRSLTHTHTHVRTHARCVGPHDFKLAF